MKNFMRKIREQHPIKDIAVFIGGVLTGAALATQDDETILSEKDKENIFLKRNSEEETSEPPFDETNSSE